MLRLKADNDNESIVRAIRAIDDACATIADLKMALGRLNEVIAMRSAARARFPRSSM
jgi:hypothetical protein